MRLLVARVGSRGNAESGGSPAASDINPLTLVKPSHLFNLKPLKLLFSLPSHHNVLFSSKLLNFDRKVVKLLICHFLRVSGCGFYPIVLILGLGLEPPRFELSVSNYSIPLVASRDLSLSFLRAIATRLCLLFGLLSALGSRDRDVGPHTVWPTGQSPGDH